MDLKSPRKNLSNEVVQRDLHTGDVIHNHYYSATLESSETSIRPIPAEIEVAVPQYFSYKEIGAGNWIFIAIVSGLCSAFIPSVSPVTGFFSFLGLLILTRNRDIAIREPGHPDSELIGIAFWFIVVSVLCLPFGWLYGWSIFF
ncbi:MAG: hypothetical protein HON05_05290 [Euryarchaeota archaeon]|jgi:hypothetical protein|nr:hypothetical protein [Euryarchaeota archaeon]MBT5026154.1 hypothetical protein [Euryarchaeota archaeon]MBT6254863.1 hypothetical protein [Euryarchaeota archaeon]MBT6526935.1 hypothetical protein [Euryarchaeota archaeon]MBT7960521.1 hypothetical protein [Euryarchaeota archaeon]